jgi:diguanylate cyclase (GGDEF)-like protein
VFHRPTPKLSIERKWILIILAHIGEVDGTHQTAMNQSQAHTGARFLASIALPAAVITAGVACVIFYFLFSMAYEVNTLDQKKTEIAANSAIATYVERIRSLTSDNANGDDAARNIGQQINQSWADGIWGSGAANENYNVVFVTDGNGHTLLGYVDGSRTAVTADRYFGQAFSKFVKEVGNAKDKKSIASGLLTANQGLVAAAAAFIRPAPFVMTPVAAQPNILVMGKKIGQPDLDHLAQRFALDGLTFTTEDKPDSQGVLLRNPGGDVVGLLEWKDGKPGSVARQKLVPTAYSAITLLVSLMIFLLLGYWRKISKIRGSEERARYEASHDNLTGLPNRKALTAQLDILLSAQRRVIDDVALVYVDLEGVKAVNNSYGFETGDRLVQAVAAGIRSLADHDHFVARLAGEEFVTVIVGVDAPRAAQRTADLILTFLQEPFDFEGRAATVNASLGVAWSSDAAGNADELLRRARVAMQVAKSAGGNIIQLYSEQIDAERTDRLKMAADLRDALKTGQLDIDYQPIVDANSRKIVGVEALARWMRNGTEYVPPDIFVSLAEENGLIDMLGEYVLISACYQTAQWPNIRLSVNVSPLQFRNPNFLHTVAAALAHSGLPPQRLELEVTESDVIEEPERAKAMIGKLHEMGVSVSLDDFGIGYSSVGFLRKFNFDKLKIDRSLVQGVTGDPDAQKLLQATVLLADALRLKVTAEGVEREEEAALLRLIGCNQFQGFLFARPQRPEHLTAILARQRQPQVDAFSTVA